MIVLSICFSHTRG